MAPKRRRPNGASIGCLDLIDLRTWLQFTATALSCILFDRPAGEAPCAGLLSRNVEGDRVGEMRQAVL
jgi:hypothetical protein